MADTKISALDAAASAAGANEIAINEAGTTKKLTVTQLAAFTPSEDQIKVATVSLSAAQIKSYFTTPIEVIAAPGEGKAIVVDEAVFSFSVGGTQFTAGGQTRLEYTTTGNNILTAIVDKTLIQGAADFVSAKSAGPTIVVVENARVDIACGTPDFATGDGTMKVFVKYRIITL